MILQNSGAPNITGKFIAQIPSGAQSTPQSKEGCFYNVPDGQYRYRVDSGTSSDPHNTGYGFNANLSSLVYSDDCDEIRTPNSSVKLWMRIS